MLPERIRAYLLYFQRCLQDGEVYEIHNLYENEFSALTDQYFSKEEWPSPKLVSGVVDDGALIDVAFLK